MLDSFDEQGYRQKLIDGGLSEADATALARRYAGERSAQAGTADGAFRPVGSLFELPDKPAAPEPPPRPHSAVVARSEQMAAESAELARTMGLPPEPRTVVNTLADKVNGVSAERRTQQMATRKTTEKPARAAGELAEQVSQAKQAALLKHTKQQIKDMQLSLFDLAPWPDHMRAMPNDFGRSAIFTTRNKKVPRAAYQRHPIYHISKDVEITYTGIELRADDDELIFAQVLEYAKRPPLGEPVTFTFYELCQDVGWSINGRYYAKAEECLTRLQASAMQFTSQRIGRLESLSLIRRFRVLDLGKRTSRCQVEIDSEIVVLFAGDHYTKFVWEKYRKLSPTARRMFDYFATHKEPYPLKLETFRLMCGSDSTRTKKWREQVGEACDELRENGLVESAWVNDDLVHCKR
ncbi:plasmid replication initiator TrfA [Xanthomonas arboricola]|uniref:plasmid replication initiator TrfA n=1 Tax=Xanthomonas arboricola TaxID=56448 RepID=UPI0003A595F6|nr:plasmid replication initiator TrfA [Xanthomonas arboricola]